MFQGVPARSDVVTRRRRRKGRTALGIFIDP
jgi:hypothetical protein